jgi:hypothetical protein
MTNFHYTTKEGDTLSRLAQYHQVVGSWRAIYDHYENRAFQKKYPNLTNNCTIAAGELITIPSQIIFIAYTGEKAVFCKTGTKILWDGHMHIESNNCAPLPIQWDSLALSTPFNLDNTSRRGKLPLGPFDKRASRKDIADAASGGLAGQAAGRLGPVGRLPTDLIAQLYMMELKNDQLRENDAWIVKRESDKNKPYDPNIMGERAKLSIMNQDSTKAYESFEIGLKSYFGKSSIHRMQLALTFDLTFGHYWGKVGIPVYIPLNGKLFFINDFIQIGTEISTSKSKELTVLFPDVYKPQSISRPISSPTSIFNLQHLYPAKMPNSNEFSFPDSFELFRQWAEPNLDPSFEPQWYNLFFHDINGSRLAVEKLLKRTFVHLIEPIFDEEKQWMEDYYSKQLPLSEGAAVDNPLSLFLFYHYDPRCHSKGDDASKATRIDELVGKINERHAFFTFKKVETPAQTFRGNRKIADRIELTAVDELNGPARWKEILSPIIRSNGWVKSQLMQSSENGIYWGIKIYPLLGYDPSDYSNYPQLKELYTACCEKNIPLLSHCSEGGMTIADYFNYMRYDKQLAHDEYDIEEAKGFFSYHYAAPSNWKKVIQDFPFLKIDLAHFGGYATWKEIESFEAIDTLSASIAAEFLIDTKPSIKDNHKTKVEKKYFHWVRAIAELVNSSENVYTDLACFVIDDTFEERNRCANNLVFLLKKFPKLKERLLVGTDWPMTEMGPGLASVKLVGVGVYMTRMFLMLQEVSRQLGYDAYHQFGLINQLRFMGMLDEKDKTKMKINVAMLDDYNKRLQKKVEDNVKWAKKSNVHFCPVQVENASFKIIEKLKSIIIPDSSKVLIDGELAIMRF